MLHQKRLQCVLRVLTALSKTDGTRNQAFLSEYRDCMNFLSLQPVATMAWPPTITRMALELELEVAAGADFWRMCSLTALKEKDGTSDVNAKQETHASEKIMMLTQVATEEEARTQIKELYNSATSMGVGVIAVKVEAELLHVQALNECTVADEATLETSIDFTKNKEQHQIVHAMSIFPHGRSIVLHAVKTLKDRQQLKHVLAKINTLITIIDKCFKQPLFIGQSIPERHLYAATQLSEVHQLLGKKAGAAKSAGSLLDPSVQAWKRVANAVLVRFM